MLFYSYQSDFSSAPVQLLRRPWVFAAHDFLHLNTDSRNICQSYTVQNCVGHELLNNSVIAITAISTVENKKRNPVLFASLRRATFQGQSSRSSRALRKRTITSKTSASPLVAASKPPAPTLCYLTAGAGETPACLVPALLCSTSATRRYGGGVCGGDVDMIRKCGKDELSTPRKFLHTPVVGRPIGFRTPSPE